MLFNKFSGFFFLEIVNKFANFDPQFSQQFKKLQNSYKWRHAIYTRLFLMAKPSLV